MTVGSGIEPTVGYGAGEGVAGIRIDGAASTVVSWLIRL